MRLLLCAFLFFNIYSSFSQSGGDSLLVVNDSIVVSDTIQKKEKLAKIEGKKKTILDSLVSKPSLQLLKIDTSNVSLNTGFIKTDSAEISSDLFGDRSLDTDEISGSIKQSVGNIKSNVLDKKDILISNNKNRLSSTSFKKQLKKQLNQLKPTGTISVGYEYGVLPFVFGDNYPTGGFKTEGNVSFMLLNVPLEFTYYYTDIKNIVGLNNYFRLSYDADRYKKLLSEKLGKKDELLNTELTGLQKEQQGIAQKLEFLKFMQSYPTYELPKVSPLSNTGYTPQIDSLNSSELSNGGFNNPYSSYSLNDTSSYFDSLRQLNNYSQKQDSITNLYGQYKTKYDSVNREIENVKSKLEQLKSFSNKPSGLPQTSNPFISKFQNALSCIKKFEIGLCNPNYSTFLLNNIPLQGINAEFQKGDKFFAISYGTTINNLLFNTNTLQGAIQTGRNLYNYFDFSNLEAGRKILCLKGGIGEKEGTHLYLGGLVGKGKTDYLLPALDPHLSSNESNVVLELDARYKFSEYLSADLIFGKSSVAEQDLTMQQISKSINEIFSNYRSNAVLFRFNAGIKKSKTKLVFTTRWIDPFFKSYGLGFLRSDNLRFEIKVEQPITSKIKYTVSYRREEDNLLKLYDYKNTLQSITNMVNLKLNRQFNLRLIYSPLFRELKSESIVIKDHNNISTAIVSFVPKAKRVNAQFNGLYSRYIISGDSTTINFENVAYTHQFAFKSGFKTDLNVSWFKNNLSDTLGNDTYLSVLDIGYTSTDK
jgi:hypothetical protein